MSEFINWRWGFLEALECIRRACLFFRLYNNQQALMGCILAKEGK